MPWFSEQHIRIGMLAGACWDVCSYIGGCLHLQCVLNVTETGPRPEMKRVMFTRAKGPKLFSTSTFTRGPMPHSA